MHNILQQRSAKFDKTRYTNLCIDRHHARTMTVLDKQRRHALMVIMREITDIKLELQAQKRAKRTSKLPGRGGSSLSSAQRPMYTRSFGEPESIGVVPYEEYATVSNVTESRRATPSASEGEDEVEQDKVAERRSAFFRTQVDIASDIEEEEEEEGEGEKDENSESLSDVDKEEERPKQTGVSKNLPRRTQKVESLEENRSQKFVEDTIRKLKLQYPKLAATFSVAIPTEDATSALAVRRYNKLRRQSQSNTSLRDKGRRNSSAPTLRSRSRLRKHMVAPSAPGDACWKVVEITPLEQLGGKDAFRLPALVTEEEKKAANPKWTKVKLSSIVNKGKKQKKVAEHDKLMFICKYKQSKENEEVMDKLEQFMSKTQLNECNNDVSTSDDDTDKIDDERSEDRVISVTIPNVNESCEF
ncbi:neurofilament medium polypeptide-like [Ptychodera flava]|uniref:neurofilament medium polypeptide-like n=1 Tax=Ptychodera flava TaxID=63121 RepID=UPI00396AA8AB